VSSGRHEHNEEILIEIARHCIVLAWLAMTITNCAGSRALSARKREIFLESTTVEENKRHKLAIALMANTHNNARQ